MIKKFLFILSCSFLTATGVFSQNSENEVINNFKILHVPSDAVHEKGTDENTIEISFSLDKIETIKNIQVTIADMRTNSLICNKTFEISCEDGKYYYVSKGKKRSLKREYLVFQQKIGASQSDEITVEALVNFTNGKNSLPSKAKYQN